MSSMKKIKIHFNLISSNVKDHDNIFLKVCETKYCGENSLKTLKRKLKYYMMWEYIDKEDRRVQDTNNAKTQ